MLPALLTKSSASKTSAAAATTALATSVTAPFRVRRCCYSAPLLEQVLRSSSSSNCTTSSMPIVPLKAITFCDDHHNHNSRRCTHHYQPSKNRQMFKMVPRWSQPYINLLLRASRIPPRQFWSTLPSFRNISSSSKNPASKDSPDTQQIFKQNDKIESYFSAIGGLSDSPPPDLTVEQITRILRTNESLIFNIETANENEKSILSQNDENNINQNDNCIAFGVFDGHNGGLCADIVSRRLFHYVAIALKIHELRSQNLSDKVKVNFGKEILQIISTDHTKSPNNVYHNIYIVYEEEIAEKLQERIEDFEWKALEKFAQDELSIQGQSDVSESIRRAFLSCDRDLSHEIQANLLNTNSNVLLHYYLSLAVSGSCATIVVMYNDQAYIASTGDCRAVLGTLKQTEPILPEDPTLELPSKPIKKKILKSTDLSFEHNAENVSELNRLMSEHPKSEHNYIIRENRLLGNLMPLRAFGDFSFKWSVDTMKQLGLTRAFGSHIIPTHYKTPPYLTAEPEITKLSLDYSKSEDKGSESEILLDRFIILASDGLWEQFESARKVVRAVNRYRQNFRQQIDAFTSANLFRIDPKRANHSSAEDSGSGSDHEHHDESDVESESLANQSVDNEELSLGNIVDRLKQKVTEPPASKFERITTDDDLIEDINCGTFLLRTALSDIGSGKSITGTEQYVPSDEETERFSHHVDQYEQQRGRHAKLVSYLTLPQSVVRNFRDDISLIVIGLKH
ncbi:[Pyruvate dehydrogenase [acetyl-transferring]]-phosphatase 1, mitochondrial [Blomia tropicalis]|nr:[Pyruvate dehydrogenase [acetyl-transferring]]-phosphatase 1, mitochondrial [Blomia tropicalis]